MAWFYLININNSMPKACSLVGGPVGELAFLGAVTIST